MSSSIAFASIFHSSMASATVNVSAEVTDLAGPRDLWELHERTWKTDPDSRFSKRGQDRYEICP